MCMCTTLIGFLVQKLHCNVTGFGSTTRCTKVESVEKDKIFFFFFPHFYLFARRAVYCTMLFNKKKCGIIWQMAKGNAIETQTHILLK